MSIKRLKQKHTEMLRDKRDKNDHKEIEKNKNSKRHKGSRKDHIFEKQPQKADDHKEMQNYKETHNVFNGANDNHKAAKGKKQNKKQRSSR